MKCGNCKLDHETSAQVLLCYKVAGKVDPTATGDQAPAPGDPGYVSSRDRHHDDRRATIEMVNMLGDRIHGGRYAIHNGKGAENDVSFYKVDKPDRGKWAGKTFVKQLLSDEEHRLSVAEAYRVLTAIVANEQAAMLLYGQKIGICGHCGRTLTNQKSRERGIGPKCARDVGWTDVA